MRTATRLRQVVVIAFVAACVHLAARPAESSTLYVTVTGSDGSASCSVGAPCRTITHAVDVAIAGDTIQVGGGTFAENNGVTINKNLTIAGKGWLWTRVILGFYEISESCCAVFNIGSDGVVTLKGMSISGGRGVFAGGVRNDGTLGLQSVRVSDNLATGQGGGGIENRGWLTMNNVAVSHNNGHFGVLNLKIAILLNSRVTGTYGWGENSDGIGNAGGTLIIDRALIAGNQGAGLHTWDPVPDQGDEQCPDTLLTNVTISSNSGGGIIATGGPNCGGHEVTLEHVTVAANTAKAGTGGLYVKLTTVSLRNSILAANGGAQCGFTNLPANVTATYSLIGDSSCNIQGPATNLIGVDPMLTPLKYGVNDPFVKVFLLGATKVHALKTGSPAIDSASFDYCAAVDQLGVLRPIDGDGDGDARCDMGAVEYRPPVRTDFRQGTVVWQEEGRYR